MTRIAPVQRPGLLARISYWFARRRVGNVPEPLRFYAHSTPVLQAYGFFELFLERARRVDPKLKTLASIRAGSLVGCPW